MADIGSGVATLLGALVGGGVSFVTTWLQSRKERRTWWDSTRKDGYVRFLGASHEYFLALMDLRHGLKRSHTDIDNLYRRANQLNSQLRMAMAEIDLVSPTRTKAAARELMSYLSETNNRLFDAKQGGRGPGLPEYQAFDSKYQPIVDAFVTAASVDIAAGK